MMVDFMSSLAMLTVSGGSGTATVGSIALATTGVTAEIMSVSGGSVGGIMRNL
jgi:hypothetical protein